VKVGKRIRRSIEPDFDKILAILPSCAEARKIASSVGLLIVGIFAMTHPEIQVCDR